LQRHGVFAQVKPCVFVLKLIGKPINDGLVEVITAEVGVAVGAFHLKHVVADFKNGDVERATAQVVHRHLLVFVLFVKPIRQRSSGRLVDNAQHLEPCNLAGLLSCLTLAVAKVGRYGNHRLAHGLPQILLSGLLHLLKNDSRNFLRRVQAVVNFYARRAAVTLHHRVGYALYLCLHLAPRLAHKPLD